MPKYALDIEQRPQIQYKLYVNELRNNEKYICDILLKTWISN